MSIEQEIEARINDFFHSMDTQNLEMMQQLIPKSETTVHVGTDTGEVWKGCKYSMMPPSNSLKIWSIIKPTFVT